MTIMSKVKEKLHTKPKVTPKRATFKPEKDMPDTSPSESEPLQPETQNLEPEPVYTRKGKKEKPPLPARFTNGGASAEEREAWIKENWGD